MNKEQTLTPSWTLAQQSYKLVRTHFTPFMYLVFLPGLLSSLGVILLGDFMTTTSDGQLQFNPVDPLGVYILLIASLWTLINLGPATHFELSATKQSPKLISEYYKMGLKDSFKLIILQLISGVIVVLGLLAFIIPGLIALRMLLLAPYYMVDKKLTLIEAIKTSAKNTKPYSRYIWGILGVQIAVIFISAFIGAIPVIGVVLSLLATYSVTFIFALRYRTIEG